MSDVASLIADLIAAERPVDKTAFAWRRSVFVLEKKTGRAALATPGDPNQETAYTERV